MSEDDDSAHAADSWRRPGTCGACSFFRDDFGSPPEFLGHCKMYPRTGARTSTDYACKEFRPLEGFDDVVRLKEQMPSRLSTQDSLTARRRSVGGPGITRRRREPGDDPETISVAEGLVTDDLLAAFATEGDEDMDTEALRRAMLSVIESFIAVDDVEIGAKWHGGTMTLQPSNPELKPYEMPLEAFFHKIVMIRDRLRVLEAKLNGHDALTDADKVELQQYISRCYGSLTSFNVLFKDKDDYFSSK